MAGNTQTPPAPAQQAQTREEIVAALRAENAARNSAILQGVKRVPGLIAGAGVDTANLLLGLFAGRGLQGLSKKPVGGSESINEAFGLKKSNNATQNIVETVGSMLSPGGMAKAIIVPAFAIKKLGDVRKAEKLISSGNAEDAWKQHGIYRDSADDMLKAVLPDTGAKINPAAETAGKIETQLPTFRGDFSWIGPAFGPKYKPVGTVQELLDHPDLYKLAPDIGNIAIQRDPLRLGAAAYVPAQDKILMGLQKGGKEEFTSMLLHEIQHAIQNQYGMARGGSSADFYVNKKIFDNALTTLYEAKKATRLDSANPKIPASVRNIIETYEDTLLDAQAQANKNYNRLPGEVEARIVQRLYEDPASLVQNPLSLMNEELLLRYGAGTTRELMPSALPAVDFTPDVQSIISNVDILRDVVLQGKKKP